jgi:hypothetical protein
VEEYVAYAETRVYVSKREEGVRMEKLTEYNITYKEWRNKPDVSVNKIIDKLAMYEITDLDPEEILQLKEDKDYWKREALKLANKLGEQKFEYALLRTRFGITDELDIDDELTRFLEASRQQDKEEDEDAERD